MSDKGEHCLLNYIKAVSLRAGYPCGHDQGAFFYGFEKIFHR